MGVPWDGVPQESGHVFTCNPTFLNKAFVNSSLIQKPFYTSSPSPTLV